MEDALRAMYADAQSRVTPPIARAYGMAFTSLMTGHPALDLGDGTRPEQHARISEHYRKALLDGIEADVDAQISERMRAGILPAGALELLEPSTQARQTVRNETRAQARSEFRHKQYQINLLLMTLVADVERSRQNAVTAACLQGADIFGDADIPEDPAEHPVSTQVL